MFDVLCVVKIKVFLTFPFAPTLTTISVGFDLWSTIEGLEVASSTRACHGRREYDAYNGQGMSSFNGFSKSTYETEPNITPRVRLLHLLGGKHTTT